MGRCAGHNGQGPGVSDVGEVRGQLHVVDEGLAQCLLLLRVGAVQHKAEDGSEAVFPEILFGAFVRRVVWQRRMNYLLYDILLLEPGC